MDKPTCETCRWWLPEPEDTPLPLRRDAPLPHGGPVGECRRYPPMMAGRGLYSDLVSIWPATAALHGCGEYSQR